MSQSAILTYSCIPCLVYMPIKSAMPKYCSKFPTAFYTHLVSFGNIRSILSNRTYATEFIVSSLARLKIIRQHYSFIWRRKAPFQMIPSIKKTYAVVTILWKTFGENKKHLQWDSNHWPVSLRVNGCLHLRLLGTPVDEQQVLWAFKNKLCVPQRQSLHFEQVPFQSVLTRLSYKCAKKCRHTDRQLFSFTW